MSSSLLRCLFMIILFSSYSLLPFVQVIADRVPIGDPLPLNSGYTVYVVSNLPSTMRIHCASCDDDLGFHDVDVAKKLSLVF